MKLNQTYPKQQIGNITETQMIEKTSSKPYLGHILGFCANLFWGLMAPIGKEALGSISPLMLTTCRMVGAAICFWLLSLFIGDMERIERKDILRIALASLFALIMNQGLYMTGLSLTSPINAAVITTLLPVLAMLFAALFIGEPISLKKVAGVMLGLLGAVTLVLNSSRGSSNGSILGDILCLASPICFAIYLTAFRDLSKKYSAITINKWMFLIASLIYLPITASDFVATPWQDISTNTLLSISYVVLFGSFIAYLCMMTAQKHIRPTVLSMYNYTAPIIASVAAILLGNGSLNTLMVLSILLIFAGVYFVTQSRAKEA